MGFDSSCVLDSSVWVALFLDGDTNHEKAADVFDELPSRVYVPYVVLAEVSTTLAYKHSKSQANNFLQFVTEDERCVLVGARTEEDIRCYKEAEEKISFADVAIMEIARSYEATLVTFDKQMKKVYERLLTR